MARRNLFLSKSKIYTVLPDTDKVDYEQTLLKAEEALKKAKLLPEDGISPEDADLIYKGHIAGKPIGQQDFGSIRDKVKASE